MKLARLWQPQQSGLLADAGLNLLSALLAWVTRSYALTPVAALVITAFAIGNAVYGMRLMWLLVREPPPAAGAEGDKVAD
jgi:uncharacterized membrane-anchored protein